MAKERKGLHVHTWGGDSSAGVQAGAVRRGEETQTSVSSSFFPVAAKVSLPRNDLKSANPPWEAMVGCASQPGKRAGEPGTEQGRH